MKKRFVTIWFPYLKTDWFTIRRPALRDHSFVLALPDHGRMIVTEPNLYAKKEGIEKGMVVADARAIIPSLEVVDDKPGLSDRLLSGIAEWCIRYTPVVAIHAPDVLILDASGCAQLWGGEKPYLTDIWKRLKRLGYTVRISMADTIGAAWAVAHYGRESPIVEKEKQREALLNLPPAALRLETDISARMMKLGLKQIGNFIDMPRSALRRRFGEHFLLKTDQALGIEEESIQPIAEIVPYQERLPCLEPIVTATGIEIALRRLLETLCERFRKEQKGLRTAVFKGFRVDGKIEQIRIGTNRPSYNTRHLFKLFEMSLPTIEPALGIELFLLEAPKVEDISPIQEKLWEDNSGLDDIALAELLDRIAGKVGADHIHRYIPDEHYWPERSYKSAPIHEKINNTWRLDRPRPLRLLAKPEYIEVMAPIPDYPPMQFRYKGKLHKIEKADGPERIEQEWWLQQGEHRDYYAVEDEDGQRYWLFRSGHYSADKSWQWYLHGFFA
jgi:protein ImuB